MVVIILPLVSLGFVSGPIWIALWNLSRGFTYGMPRTLNFEFIDGVPVWSCQSAGYLHGGPWTFLGIDIRFGRMSFAQAKTLDMIWNWTAGRGVQFILAWFTYHVFTSALMRTAEVAHVPYGLFTSLSLYSARPCCLWDIGKGLLTIRGVRIKFIMAWLLFSTVYLAAFPSLLDVMSGYEGSIRTELLLPNKTTLDLTNIRTFMGVLYNSTCGGAITEGRPCLGYFLSYNFYDANLNSSWHSYAENQTWDNTSTDTFYTQIPSNYNCVAEQNVYQWGFSGEWVLVVICVNGFWVLGMWILWLDTELKSQLTIAGRRMGPYRAIRDISEAMREDLGPNLCGYSEKELAAAVQKQGPVKYFVTEGKDDEAGRIGLSSRRSEKVRLTWGRKYG